MSISKINNLAKVSLIGAPAVGKTTMLKLLSQTKIDKIYLPTQGFDLKTVSCNNMDLKVWDFGGQRAYLNYLEEYLLGSDLVFIVTDSTPKNVLKSKQLVDMAKKIVEEDCPIIAIANKQDLCKDDGRMDQKRVQDVLHTKTYGLTAINSSERDKLMRIIEKELNHAIVRKEMKTIEI
ncbi:MAG: GTP-binding protein [Candidatus Lokiarchaeota archaeon]|nr:GTP-binding protein [Candidatus Lokiarchaeota archaeon]